MGADTGGVSRRRLLAGAAAGAAILGTGSLTAAIRSQIVPATGDEPAARLVRPPRKRWLEEWLGYSVEGRPIKMFVNRSERERFRLLVVSAVHGDERGAGTVGLDVVNLALPDHVSGFVIPILNPDGWARGDRYNANGVDLNRNFPWAWAPFDGGSAPLSEPEALVLAGTVDYLEPNLAVFVHQPYDYVSPISTGAERYARAWSQAAGLPYKPAIAQHGGCETWAAKVMGIDSILVEAPTREATPDVLSAQRRGLEALVEAI